MPLSLVNPMCNFPSVTLKESKGLELWVTLTPDASPLPLVRLCRDSLTMVGVQHDISVRNHRRNR